MLFVWGPYTNVFERLRQEMNTLLDRRFFGRGFWPTGLAREGKFPRVNMAETAEGLTVTVRAAGRRERGRRHLGGGRCADDPRREEGPGGPCVGALLPSGAGLRTVRALDRAALEGGREQDPCQAHQRGAGACASEAPGCEAETHRGEGGIGERTGRGASPGLPRPPHGGERPSPVSSLAPTRRGERERAPCSPAPTRRGGGQAGLTCRRR